MDHEQAPLLQKRRLIAKAQQELATSKLGQLKLLPKLAADPTALMYRDIFEGQPPFGVCGHEQGPTCRGRRFIQQDIELFDQLFGNALYAGGGRCEKPAINATACFCTYKLSGMEGNKEKQPFKCVPKG